MKPFHTRALANALTTAAALFGLLAMPAAPIFGQSNRPTGPTDRADPAKIRFEDTSKREMELRNLGRPTAELNKDPKRREALGAQVETDFERILTLHNQMVHAITSDNAFDYGFVAEAAGDIKKRAAHLQSVLTLPKPDADERNGSTDFRDTDMKAALVAFCKRIESFVRNPIIENPGTVDPQQTARARRDLEGVVQLGDRVKKMAERLKKTAK